MFYLIGLGLSDYSDIPLKGLNALKECDYVFFEKYTSIISEESIKELKSLIGKDVIELKREDLESNFENLVLKKAKEDNAALLIAGDPLTATTHVEFLRSCKENGVDYKVIHASSVYSSVCETGLHVYKFGKSCSVPYPEREYNPTSYYDVVESNYKNKAHTLVFLDIKADKNKYMTINEGLNLLLKSSKEKKGFFNKDTEIIGIARIGSDNQIIKYGSVQELLSFEFGYNPHVLIIPNMNEIEKEYVKILYS